MLPVVALVAEILRGDTVLTSACLQLNKNPVKGLLVFHELLLSSEGKTDADDIAADLFTHSCSFWRTLKECLAHRTTLDKGVSPL